MAFLSENYSTHEQTMTKKIINVIRIAVLSFITLICMANVAYAGNLEVHFIDVGQADAALIKCDGHNMLIDGGNASDSSKIYSYLKKQGVTSLDYIVNSHGDEDHVGGLPGAIQLVGKNIKTVLAPYKTYEKDRFQVFTRKLGEVGKEITVPKKGDIYFLGDNASFRILSSGGTGDNESIVLRLEYGATSFLFTGDAGEEQERAIVNSGYKIESDVLKVGHHGSATSTCYQFLRAVYPSAAVICVGKDNSYGHPTDAALSKLRDEGAQVFRTDNNGTIVFYSDGNNIQYSTQKESTQEKNLIPGESKVKDVSSSAQVKQPEAAKNMTSNESGDNRSYVLNKNTKKFHYPNCSSVGKMKAKNREDVEDTRDNIIARGYVPCKNCNP